MEVVGVTKGEDGRTWARRDAAREHLSIFLLSLTRGNKGCECTSQWDEASPLWKRLFPHTESCKLSRQHTATGTRRRESFEKTDQETSPLERLKFHLRTSAALSKSLVRVL